MAGERRGLRKVRRHRLTAKTKTDAIGELSGRALTDSELVAEVRADERLEAGGGDHV